MMVLQRHIVCLPIILRRLTTIEASSNIEALAIFANERGIIGKIEEDKQYEYILTDDKVCYASVIGTLDLNTIKCNSHRARKKLYDLYPFLKGHTYFSWKREGEFYKLSPEQARLALQITGISKSRDKGDLNRCMNL